MISIVRDARFEAEWRSDAVKIMSIALDTNRPPATKRARRDRGKGKPGSRAASGAATANCRHESTQDALAGWVESYLMQPHGQLGRSGPVCPFTRPAARHGALRLAVETASGADPKALLKAVREAMDALDRISCEPQLRHLRAVIIAFPGCDDEAGLGALKKVQRRLRLRAFMTRKMIGLFHGGTEAPGLWNPEFRPLRSPFPLIAIRSLVVEDAPFALRHWPLFPVFLAWFPRRGPRQLLAHLNTRNRREA